MKTLKDFQNTTVQHSGNSIESMERGIFNALDCAVGFAGQMQIVKSAYVKKHGANFEGSKFAWFVGGVVANWRTVRRAQMVRDLGVRKTWKEYGETKSGKPADPLDSGINSMNQWLSRDQSIKLDFNDCRLRVIDFYGDTLPVQTFKVVEKVAPAKGKDKTSATGKTKSPKAEGGHVDTSEQGATTLEKVAGDIETARAAVLHAFKSFPALAMDKAVQVAIETAIKKVAAKQTNVTRAKAKAKAA